MTAAFNKALDLYPAPPEWDAARGFTKRLDADQLADRQHMVFLRESLTTDNWVHMVRAFRTVMQRRIPASPTALTPEQKQHHAMLLMSEVNEFAEAGDIIEQADGLLDVIYVAIGGLVELGLSNSQIFAGMGEVQASNMTKVQDNGTPLVNNGIINPEEPIGKVLKTHNYIRPALAEAMSLEQD